MLKGKYNWDDCNFTRKGNFKVYKKNRKIYDYMKFGKGHENVTDTVKITSKN